MAIVKNKVLCAKRDKCAKSDDAEFKQIFISFSKKKIDLQTLCSILKITNTEIA
jgi:hypothetical protein